jgi:hypothetical protein
MVTPNLFTALRTLHEIDRPLWVDSLCINQKDDVERGSQVQRMGLIYTKADTVIMWLGEEENSSDMAMNFLNEFRQVLAEDSQGRAQISQMLGDAAYDPAWVALRHLFERPYWSRLWILQEVLLARNPVIACGACFTSWEFLQQLLILLNSTFTTHVSTAARETMFLRRTHQITGVALQPAF